MKRMMMIIAMVTTIVASASAMSLSKARTEALFLSDKMAYVLNLTDDQYNAVYEINLDYILQVSSRNDVFGSYWQQRNTNLQYVLTDAQYATFLATEYFYRPLNWSGSQLVYVIHNRYPQNRYYRAAPRNYKTYSGGNRSYSYSAYQGRTYSKDRGVQPRRQVSQQPTMKRSQAIRQSSKQGQRSFGNGTQTQSPTTKSRQGNNASSQGNTQQSSQNRTFGNR